ncbi:MAG: hypothetical protein ACXVAN_11955 [Polyangia bacterium]
MESAEAVAAKRRVLIDALMMCLTKSRVMQVVDAKTVRSVIDSASGELWRQGEFRLDPVWKMLIAQPGLTAEDVAPPLLMFKAYEGELGVAVRLPQALSAIPRGEQIRLREALGIERDDFAKAIDELKALAASEAAEQRSQQVMRDAEASYDKAEASRTGPKKKAKATPSKQAKALAAVLALVALCAIGGSVWWALRDTSAGYNLSDVTGILQLSNGRSAGPSVTATISDPKWETLSTEERKKAVSAIMDLELGKGVKSLILLDNTGTMRAMVTETPNGRSIVLP